MVTFNRSRKSCPSFIFLIAAFFLVSRPAHSAQSACVSFFERPVSVATAVDAFEFTDFKKHLGERFRFDDEQAEVLFRIYPHFQEGFRSPQFYAVLAEHPDVVKKLYKRWYKKNPADLEQIENVLGSTVFPLILDPGIRYRLKDFLRFTATLPPVEKKTAIRVRDLYSKNLGTRIIYRGLHMRQESLTKAIANRFLAGFIAGSASSESIRRFSQFIFQGPNADLEQRLRNDHSWELLSQSFSAIKDLSIGFAVNDSQIDQKNPVSDVLPILLTTQVPVLDLIDLRMVTDLKFARHIFKVTTFEANGKTIWGGSSGLELIIFGQLDPMLSA